MTSNNNYPTVSYGGDDVSLTPSDEVTREDVSEVPTTAGTIDNNNNNNDSNKNNKTKKTKKMKKQYRNDGGHVSPMRYTGSWWFSPKAQMISRWSMLAVTLLSWLFMVFSVGDCHFLETLPKGNMTGNYAEFGLFGRAYYDPQTSQSLGCLKYTSTQQDNYIDASVYAARVFGVLNGLVLSTAAVGIASLLLFLTAFQLEVWRILRGLYIVASVLNLLQFSMFGNQLCTGNNYDCHVSFGAIVAIVNIFLLLALVAMSWLVQAPRGNSSLFILRGFQSSQEENSFDDDDVDGEDGRVTMQQQKKPKQDTWVDAASTSQMDSFDVTAAATMSPEPPSPPPYVPEEDNKYSYPFVKPVSLKMEGESHTIGISKRPSEPSSSSSETPKEETSPSFKRRMERHRQNQENVTVPTTATTTTTTAPTAKKTNKGNSYVSLESNILVAKANVAEAPNGTAGGNVKARSIFVGDSNATNGAAFVGDVNETNRSSSNNQNKKNVRKMVATEEAFFDASSTDDYKQYERFRKKSFKSSKGEDPVVAASKPVNDDNIWL